MSSLPAISKDTTNPGERRGLPREAFNHYVVLVFFGEDNWGKLTNMSEKGMAFEFSRLPSLHEKVTFTFQVVGCMPMRFRSMISFIFASLTRGRSSNS